MKKSILIACLGLVSLGLQAQSISLAGEWNVELGKSGSAFAKSKRAFQGEVKRAILPGQKMKTSYDTYIEVSENKGGEYRRIGVKFTFIDVF